MTIEAPNGNYSLPASLVQREVDSPSGEDEGIAGFDCFFLRQFFSENYNPSVASGDSSLYTREPLGVDFTASLVQREVDSPSGEDGGIAGFDCFFCCRSFSENYNPSVASGDSSLYTSEPLGGGLLCLPCAKGGGFAVRRRRRNCRFRLFFLRQSF